MGMRKKAFVASILEFAVSRLFTILMDRSFSGGKTPTEGFLGFMDTITDFNPKETKSEKKAESKAKDGEARYKEVKASKVKTSKAMEVKASKVKTSKAMEIKASKVKLQDPVVNGSEGNVSEAMEVKASKVKRQDPVVNGSERNVSEAMEVKASKVKLQDPVVNGSEGKVSQRNVSKGRGREGQVHDVDGGQTYGMLSDIGCERQNFEFCAKYETSWTTYTRTWRFGCAAITRLYCSLPLKPATWFEGASVAFEKRLQSPCLISAITDLSSDCFTRPVNFPDVP